MFCIEVISVRSPSGVWKVSGRQARPQFVFVYVSSHGRSLTDIEGGGGMGGPVGVHAGGGVGVVTG